MAGFNIVAQIQLQAPTNLSRIASQIRSSLQGINANINLNLSSGALNSINNLTSSINNLNASIRGLNTSTATLNTTFANFASNANRFNSAVSNTTSNLQAQAVAAVANAKAIKSASEAAEEFGKAAGLAGRRFLGFTLIAGSVAGTIVALKNAVTEAVAFEREFIKISQINNITAGELAALNNEITRLATSFGVSNKELVNTAVTLKQAGLSAKEITSAMEVLAKTTLAPSFENIRDTTEGVIAIMSQFKIEAKDVEIALGSINSVANSFAVESKDLISAVRRSGGAFKAVGGDLNEFISLFTSVRATTRESAESIATGLRTIFTRLQRSDTVSSLEQLGINLRYTREEAEALGQTNLEKQFVGAYEAVRRLSQGLAGLRSTDPRYSSVIEELGGYRQISKAIPLIQEFTLAQRALAVAQAGGTSITQAADKAQETFLVKLSKVKEEFLAFGRVVVSSQGFQSFLDTALKLGNAFVRIADALSPLIPLLTTLTAIKLTTNFASFFTGLSEGFSGRGPKRFATGGVVPGHGNSDTVPALLTPGEFVINKTAAQSIGYSNLNNISKFAAGGNVNFKVGKKNLSSDDVYFLYKLAAEKQNASKYLSPEINGVPNKTGINNQAYLKKLFGDGDYSTPAKVFSAFGFPGKGKNVQSLRQLRDDLERSSGFLQERNTLLAKGSSLVRGKTLYAPFGGDGIGYVTMPLGGGEKGKVGRDTLNAGIRVRELSIDNLGKKVNQNAKGLLEKAGIEKIVGAVNVYVMGSQPTAEFYNEILGEVSSNIQGIYTKKFGASRTSAFNKNQLSTISGYLFEKYIEGITGKPTAGETSDFEYTRSNLNSVLGPKFDQFVFPSPIKSNYIDLKSSYSRGNDSDIIKKYINSTSRTGKLLEALGQAPAKFATGGIVPGSGHGDTVPAMLTPGEFVIKKASAQAIGYDNLANINRYASGGTVQIRPPGGEIGVLTTESNAVKNSYDIVMPKSGFSQQNISKFNFKTGNYKVPNDNVAVRARNYIPFNQPQAVEFRSKLERRIIGDLSKLSKEFFPQQSINESYSSEILDKTLGTQGLGRMFEAVLQFAFAKQAPSKTGDIFDFVPPHSEGLSRFIGKNIYADAKYADTYFSRASILGKAVNAINAGLPGFDFTYPLLTQKEKTNVSKVASSSLTLSRGDEQSSLASDDFNKKIIPTPKKYAGGGVASLLTPGEFVVNKETASRVGPTALNYMNNNGRLPQKFATGGFVVNKASVFSAFKKIQDISGINFRDIGALNDIKLSSSPAVSNALGGQLSSEYRGIFYPVTKRVVINPNTVNSEESLLETLSHELGHSIDAQRASVLGTKSYYASNINGNTYRRYADRYQERLEKQYPQLYAKIIAQPENLRKYTFLPEENFANLFASYIDVNTRDRTAPIFEDFDKDILSKLRTKKFADGGYVENAVKLLNSRLRINNSRKIFNEVKVQDFYPDDSPLDGVAYANRNIYLNNRLNPTQLHETLLHEIGHTADSYFAANTYGIPVNELKPSYATSIKGNLFSGIVNREYIKQRNSLLGNTNEKAKETLGNLSQSRYEYMKYLFRKEELFAEAFKNFALGDDTHKKAFLKAFKGFNKGGKSEDTVPALLTPGEFVINKDSANRLGSNSLNYMNATGKIPGYNRGGEVRRYTSAGRVNIGSSRTADDFITSGYNRNLSVLDNSVASAIKLDSLTNSLIEITKKHVLSLNAGLTEQQAYNVGVERVNALLKTNFQLIANNKGELVGYTNRGFANQPVSKYSNDLRQSQQTNLNQLLEKLSNEAALKQNKPSFRERLSGIAGLLASTGVTYAASGLESLAGTAEQAALSGSGTAYSLAKAGSSALSSGATIGFAGGNVFGPIGAAIGGTIGALSGFITALTDANREILNAKIGLNIKKLGEQFEILNKVSLRDISVSNISVASSVIGDLLKDSRKRSISEATTLGVTNIPSFINASQKNDREVFQNSLPNFIEFLNKNIEEQAKNFVRNPENANLQGAELRASLPTAQLLAGNNGLNQQLVDILSKFRPREEVVADLQKQQLQAIQRQRIQAVQTEGRIGVGRELTVFERFSSSIENVSREMNKLQIVSQSLQDAFEGVVSVSKIAINDRAGNLLGIGNRFETENAINNVGSAFGSNGSQLRQFGNAFDEVSRILPGIISQVVQQGGGLRDTETTVDSRIRNLLTGQLGGAARVANNPELNAIIGAVSSQASNLNYDKLIQEGRLDAGKLIEKLLSDAAPFKELFSSLTKQIGEAANRYNEELDKHQKRLQKIGEQEDRVRQLQLQALRFSVERNRPAASSADILSFQQLSEPITFRARRLAELGGVNGNNAENASILGSQLRDVNSRIESSQRNLQTAFDRFGLNSPQYKEAEQSLRLLKNQSNSLTTALTDLTNAAKATAAQEKLAIINKDREGRLSFTERYITSDITNRIETQRNSYLTSQALNQGNLLSFNEEQRRGILDFLSQTSEISLTGFGGKRGKELRDDLLGNTASALGLGQPVRIANEGEQLRDVIAKAFNTAIEAERQLIDSRRELDNNLISNLERQQREFFDRLLLNSTQDLRSRAETNVLTGESRLAESRVGFENANRLRNLGIVRQEQLEALRTAKDDSGKNLLEKYESSFRLRNLNIPERVRQIIDNNPDLGSVNRGNPGLEQLRETLAPLRLNEDKLNEIIRLAGSVNTGNPTNRPRIEQVLDRIRQQIPDVVNTRNQLRDNTAIQNEGLSAIARGFSDGTLTSQQLLGLGEGFNQNNRLENAFNNFLDSTLELRRLKGILDNFDLTIRNLSTRINENRPGFVGPPTPGAGLATGGIIGSSTHSSIGGPRGTDTVPAWLTPGEFVVNRKAAQANLGLLHALNGGQQGGGGYFALGGLVTRDRLFAVLQNLRGRRANNTVNPFGDETGEPDLGFAGQLADIAEKDDALFRTIFENARVAAFGYLKFKRMELFNTQRALANPAQRGVFGNDRVNRNNQLTEKYNDLYNGFLNISQENTPNETGKAINYISRLPKGIINNLRSIIYGKTQQFGTIDAMNGQMLQNYYINTTLPYITNYVNLAKRARDEAAQRLQNPGINELQRTNYSLQQRTAERFIGDFADAPLDRAAIVNVADNLNPPNQDNIRAKLLKYAKLSLRGIVLPNFREGEDTLRVFPGLADLGGAIGNVAGREQGRANAVNQARNEAAEAADLLTKRKDNESKLNFEEYITANKNALLVRARGFGGDIPEDFINEKAAALQNARNLWITNYKTRNDLIQRGVGGFNRSRTEDILFSEYIRLKDNFNTDGLAKELSSRQFARATAEINPNLIDDIRTFLRTIPEGDSNVFDSFKKTVEEKRNLSNTLQAVTDEFPGVIGRADAPQELLQLQTQYANSLVEYNRLSKKAFERVSAKRFGIELFTDSSNIADFLRLARGGSVPGTGFGDSVPALLTPGEFVINKAAASAIGFSNLQKMNSVAKYADGGNVSPSSPSIFNQNVGGLFGRINVNNIGGETEKVGSTFSNSVKELNSVFNTFAGFISPLVEALKNFPSTITGSFTHNVSVNLNGAEILKNLEPTIKELVENQTAEVLRNYIRNNLYEAGQV